MTMSQPAALEQACRHSAYVAGLAERDPALLADMGLAALDPVLLAEECRPVAAISGEDDFRRALRRLRHRHMARIVIRDFAGLAALDETLADTSDVADALIRTAHDWAYDHLRAQWGTPMGQRSGLPQTMIVLGMGKLGGRELNFSSDIDLIFAFPESGETQGGPRRISNEEFFVKLGRLMNASLTVTTDWGFVYRVDMRLRPFGASGQLAQSFDSLDNYYRTHGRPWERHAMVKARAITGRPDDIARLYAILTPFVYRSYADFSMLDALRQLKQMIADDLARNGQGTDLKLGKGGIRDVEFIVQCFQLIHGGRDHTLRGRSLLPMLAELGQRRYLDPAQGQQLARAYGFLRRLENHVQMWQDQQTHTLPDDPAQQHRLAQGMGYDAVPPFLSDLDATRRIVAQQFDAVFAAEPAAPANGWQQVWADPKHAPLPIACADPEHWREHLWAFQSTRRYGQQSAEDRQRLDDVIHLLLAEIHDLETLKRVLQVLEAVLRRSVYLVLLKSSAQARQTLIRLCAASPWLTDILAASPALLDQMLNSTQLFTLPDRAQLVAEMQIQLGAAPDDEHLMTVIRQVKQASVFKVAANDLINDLALMKVSDHLTWIAEAVVEVTLDRLWRNALARNGQPGGWDQPQPPFLVIGFGKLGGLELGYGSDLDMVFLSHDDLPATAMSTGPHPLEGAIYLTRLGQRLINVLSTTLISGAAYQVDSRLRPHGASGILINSLQGFFRYERQQAWVWEHQALIRTRAIAGHPQMQAQFERMRRDFLCQPRDRAVLRREILAMRQKMRTHLDRSKPDRFDLKQGTGGIIDLEFLVQFLILNHAHAAPHIAQYSDNIRQLASLAQAGIIGESDRTQLTQTYLALRRLAHQAALAKTEAFCPPETVASWRQIVQSAWKKHLEQDVCC